MLEKFILSMMIGAFMGLLTHMKRNKHIKKPKINKASWNPGFLLDCAFGAIASLVGILVAAPEQIERVILIAILAGYAGEGFIRRISDSNIEGNEEINALIKSELAHQVKLEKTKDKSTID